MAVQRIGQTDKSYQAQRDAAKAEQVRQAAAKLLKAARAAGK